MSTNGITAQATHTTTATRRRQFAISGIVLRVLIALIISWLIVMAFFVTAVVSH